MKNLVDSIYKYYTDCKISSLGFWRQSIRTNFGPVYRAIVSEWIVKSRVLLFISSNADNTLDIYYNDVSGKELGLVKVHGMDFTHSGNVYIWSIAFFQTWRVFGNASTCMHENIFQLKWGIYSRLRDHPFKPPPPPPPPPRLLHKPLCANGPCYI